MKCINYKNEEIIAAKAFPHFHISTFITFVSARALGFEPRSKVLETRMLPLHHARKKAKSY